MIIWCAAMARRAMWWVSARFKADEDVCGPFVVGQKVGHRLEPGEGEKWRYYT